MPSKSLLNTLKKNERNELALNLREEGKTYRQIGEALGVSLERARQRVLNAERLKRKREIQADGYLLQERTYNCLWNSGYFDVGADSYPRKWRPDPEAVAQLHAAQLLRIPNFGRVSLEDVRAWLADHGLALRDDTPPRGH